VGLTDPQPDRTGRPLTIWAVSDGRAGIEAQVLGLAEAVAELRPAHIEPKRIGWAAGLGRLPWRLIPPFSRTGDPIAAPWPDIWIAAGRATLPLSTRIRRWSGGRTFVVQTQDPRTSLKPFDLVVPPVHDDLHGDNVLPIVGAPSRLTPAKLGAEAARFRERLATLPHPHVAVIVGGKSKSHDLPPLLARALAEQIAEAVTVAGGSVLVSFTRRTPAAAREVMQAELASVPSWIWDDQGENPYFALLAAADAILVTADSTNLATDAAATGKPVHVLPMHGYSARLASFHDDLRERGIARIFLGSLETWTYEPLRETERAARELLRRYDLRA
jgi:mitochondrial fission protein ELM1